MTVLPDAVIDEDTCLVSLHDPHHQRHHHHRSGMRTLPLRLSTRKPPSPKTGLRMSPPLFLTPRLRSPRIGTTRRMATGSHPLSPTPSATKSLAAASGSLL